MFPEPIKIGLKRIAYWESEVEGYLATRARASYPGAQSKSWPPKTKTPPARAGLADWHCRAALLI